jgi:hypothetical protein
MLSILQLLAVRFFYVPHLLWYGTFTFNVVSKRTVILNDQSSMPSSSKEAITTYFNILGFMQLARAGLELTTFQSQGRSSTIESWKTVNINVFAQIHISYTLSDLELYIILIINLCLKVICLFHFCDMVDTYLKTIWIRNS